MRTFRKSPLPTGVNVERTHTERSAKRRKLITHWVITINRKCVKLEFVKQRVSSVAWSSWYVVNRHFAREALSQACRYGVSPGFVAPWRHWSQQAGVTRRPGVELETTAWRANAPATVLPPTMSLTFCYGSKNWCSPFETKFECFSLLS